MSSNAHASQTRMVWLEQCSKMYGSVAALQEIDLAINSGEFLTLLGPSGSGKTTILNLIAGMVPPTSGRIWIDGKDATRLPANQRGLGMVFQNYALMPHMTVFENVAFPLKVRRMSRGEIARRVAEALEIVRLPDVAARKPSELSGGQQQRIAIARCLVYNPAIILMDEPLGALDKKLREELQLEIKQLHTRLGITILYVTHDQQEALTMSDRIVLMNGGRIEQAGTPDDLYFRPVSLFSAEFLGDSNIFDVRVVEAGPVVKTLAAGGYTLMATGGNGVGTGSQEKLLVRPENITLLRDGVSNSLPNQIEATVIDSIILGGVVKVFARLDDGTTVVVQELTRAVRAAAPDARVRLAWSAEDTLVLPQRADARA